MPAMPERVFATFCNGLESSGRRRVLREVGHRAAGGLNSEESDSGEQEERLPPGRVMVDGRELVNVSSNDYLGLSRHPQLIARSAKWGERWGTGSGASRLVSGNLEPFARVEQKLASGKGTETALVFASGYQANASILPALLDSSLHGAQPLIFTDRLNHASLHAGCNAAGVRQIRDHHNDMDHLEKLLEAKTTPVGGKGPPAFIISETVFSMDGDRANIPALADLARRFGTFLYLDEAHATGVLGRNGFGLAADYPGVANLVMGTFGKALGGFGAYAACSDILRDYLVNRCGGFVYSTALPPTVLGAMDAALDLIPIMEEARARLLRKAEELRAEWREAGLDCGASTTHILPLILGDDEAAMALSCSLEKEGFLAVAIRPPTVCEGTSRLRITLSSAHEDGDLARLSETVIRLAGKVSQGSNPGSNRGDSSRGSQRDAKRATS